MGTGLNDEYLAKHHEFFQQHVIDKPRSYYRYGDSVTPDVWFDAVQVLEPLTFVLEPVTSVLSMSLAAVVCTLNIPH